MIVNDGLGKDSFKAIPFFHSFLKYLLSHFCELSTVLDTEGIVLNCSSVTSVINNLGAEKSRL